MIAALALVLAITPNAIKAHIDFLASDVLEGREAGTRGYDVAAAYVATQFEAAGAAPAGDNGTYLQQVRFRTLRFDPAQSSFSIDGVPFAHRKDVILHATNAPVNDVDAEIVFAGFGITSKEMNRDDYAGIDARGKIVAILTGAPPQFPHSERAYYSNGSYKQGNAVAHGAIGLLVVRTLETERRTSWERVIERGDSIDMLALDRNGQPLDDFPQLRGGATLGRTAAQQLFGSELERILADAENGISRSFPLHKRAANHTVSTLGETTSPNVVAMVRGSRLPNEYVVVSAHLDHIGIAQQGADRIRNGALDNASGIAALIEIARGVASMHPHPARSIVFIAVTAEEKSLQGSAAFADHPSIHGTIVANVNMDMLTMLFPMRNLVALGIEHSTLGPLAAEAAKRNGFAIQDDPLPEEVRFVRSDQFSFVKKGIPAISYKGGFHDDATAKITRDWLHDVYHTVRDESSQQLDYDSGARWAQTNLDLAVMIANEKKRPRWNAGDFFSVSR